MPLNPELDSLSDYPFEALRALLNPVTPRVNDVPIAMSVGEPQHQPPALLTETLAAHAHEWNKYPPMAGTPELRQAIASHVAAQETLDAHGPATGPESIEARKAIETHLEVARHRIQELLGHIIGGAKVFLGGGQEANGIELGDKVQDSANSALVRLFPQFSEADHANWGQVLNRARAGDVGALQQVTLDFPAGGLGNALDGNDVRNLETGVFVEESAHGRRHRQEFVHAAAM